jgi:hypothetical protein
VSGLIAEDQQRTGWAAYNEFFLTHPRLTVMADLVLAVCLAAIKR